MSGNQPNEVDEVIRDLKKNRGFSAFVVMNNDGIVIRHEQMEYKMAVHHAYLVLDLMAKARGHVHKLFEAPENEDLYEMIVSQQGNFTLVVIQMEEKETPKEAAAEGAAAEGEGEKKAE